ncbi:MAG: class IV adenylate cyclase [Thermofilum sp.]
MSREVELKFRCENLESVRSKLASLGASFVKVAEQVDIYFQHPCRDFAERDEALRLRVEEGGVSELTYKGPREGGVAKAREELSTTVNDPAATAEILKRLGFFEVARVRKRREVYRVSGVEVALDTVEGLGSFVELEDKGGGVAELRKVAEELGVGGEPLRETYLEMLMKVTGRSP